MPELLRVAVVDELPSAVSGCFRCGCLLLCEAGGVPFTAVALPGVGGSFVSIEQSALGIEGWCSFRK